MTAADVARLKNALAFGKAFAFSTLNTGVGLPPGGTTGEVLTKVSNANFDADWEPLGAGGGILDGGHAGSSYPGGGIIDGGDAEP